MFELSVQRVFSAAHAIVMRGEREPLHGHDWNLELVVTADRLDDDGLLCDFHAVQAVVDEVIRPFQSVNLNQVPPFDHLNPTAEVVARHIAESTAARLPAGVRVARVRLTEAPGCAAHYHPRHD
jgi:6-pyruvoyltetrahydropterin/6-carboxytetrahydropterin synthase